MKTCVLDGRHGCATVWIDLSFTTFSLLSAPLICSFKTRPRHHTGRLAPAAPFDRIHHPSFHLTLSELPLNLSPWYHLTISFQGWLGTNVYPDNL